MGRHVLRETKAFAVSSVKYGLNAGAWRCVPIFGSLCFILVFESHAIKMENYLLNHSPGRVGLENRKE